MGVGYDDDTLIAEHREHEKKQRKRKHDLVFVATTLTGIWIIILGLLYDCLSGVSVHGGTAVWLVSMALAVSVALTGIYWDSTI